MKLEFCEYEIENIINSLQNSIYKEYSNCKWEMQEYGNYYYTPNKKVKQLTFTINSIKRQLEWSKNERM